MTSSGIALPRTAGDRSLVHPSAPFARLALLGIALAVSCLAAAAAAAPALGAAPGRAALEELSPRLGALAKRPSLRAAPPGRQAKQLDVAAEGPGSLLRDGNRVLVEVRFGGDPGPGVARLRAAGARIEHISRRYDTVTVSVLPADLQAMARAAGVEFAKEVITPIASATECHGLVTSEGDIQLAAQAARQNFGIDGTGVTVGVLSDSFDTDPFALTHAFQDVASGDLPGTGNPCGRTTPVLRLNDLSSPGNTIDEGRAMAQIVHDLAPGAAIDFATAFTGETEFADNIRALAAAGADVLVDDVSYFDEPFFQEGPVGVAAGDAVASGAVYFSSAGNNNLIDSGGNDIASWEAPKFRDSKCPPELATLIEAEGETCMDFDPGEKPAEVDPTFGITVEPDETLTIDLQWAEPRFGAEADLDVFLLDDEDEPIAGNCHPLLPVVGSCENNVAGSEGSSERPVEVFSWENESSEVATVNLAINRCFSTEKQKEEEEEAEELKGCNPFANPEAEPRLKFAILQNGGGVTETEYPESQGEDVVGPTIFGHNGSANAVSTAAVRFNTNAAPEEFSSRGPVKHFFGPVVGTTPAPPQPEEVLAKPDLAATDCGVTTFFLPTGVPGVNRFCGTSAAAPHAAAVAALMLSSNPGLATSQVQTALAVSARPVGSFGVNAVGAGLVDALGAVARVALPPQVRIDSGPKPLGNNPRPAITFSANRPAAFACAFDGAAPSPCASPFIPPPLADGTHHFAVSGTDVAGRSGHSQVISFTIDTRAPRTFIRKKPRKVIRIRQKRVRARFLFGSNDPTARFSCKVDRRRYRNCRARFIRRYGVGRHVVRVRARDALGNVDQTPAVYRFRVRRRGEAPSVRRRGEQRTRETTR